VFSVDGRRVLTASADKTARLWLLLPANAPSPAWFGDFFVFVGGKRIAAHSHQLEDLSEMQLQELQAQLRSHLNEDNDYARLLRWRLSSAEERPVDPYGTTTQAQAADRIIRSEINSAEARHVYNLDPWHPLIHLALAGFEEDSVRADFLRKYSLDRLPNDPKLRRCAVELLRKQGQENLARQLEGSTSNAE
jgi:hypothetical protein